MRIWDISPRLLCRAHLLGEHRELHALWSILVNDKKGYRRHPETKRWEGKLAALYKRHQLLVKEMKRRNFRHFSELDKTYATGTPSQRSFVDTPGEQRQLLKLKNCDCFR